MQIHPLEDCAWGYALNARNSNKSSSLQVWIIKRRDITDHNLIYKSYWALADGRSMTVQTVLLHSKVKDVLGELQRESWKEHLGVNKTQDKIRQWCYWLHASSDVQRWCSPCDILHQAKVQVLNGLMHQYNVGALFERITLDFQRVRGGTDTSWLPWIASSSARVLHPPQPGSTDGDWCWLILWRPTSTTLRSEELHSDKGWQAMIPAGSVKVPGNLQDMNNHFAPTVV